MPSQPSCASLGGGTQAVLGEQKGFSPASQLSPIVTANGGVGRVMVAVAKSYSHLRNERHSKAIVNNKVMYGLMGVFFGVLEDPYLNRTLRWMP